MVIYRVIQNKIEKGGLYRRQKLSSRGNGDSKIDRENHTQMERVIHFVDRSSGTCKATGNLIEIKKLKKERQIETGGQSQKRKIQRIGEVKTETQTEIGLYTVIQRSRHSCNSIRGGRNTDTQKMRQ